MPIGFILSLEKNEHSFIAARQGILITMNFYVIIKNNIFF